MRGRQLIQSKRRYQKLRRICWILALGIAAALVITLVAIDLLSAGPARGQHLLTRSTDETFLTRGDELAVQLFLEPSAVPRASAMPPDGWRLDVLIGLDNSLTMRLGDAEESAFERIRRVATTFIEATDLERHQVGIVRLDEEAQVVQGLSRNRPVLERVVANLPEGRSTRIHEALDAMVREFGSIRRQPGALGLAILLTDGRTSAAAARRAAERLKAEQGVFIAPIGIGDAVDDDLLQGISSFPTEYRKANATEELTAIYRDWLANMEQLVAVDVRVEESFNQKAFAFAGGAPGSSVAEGRLEWRFPFLTTEPRRLDYALKAAALGWYDVDEPQGQVSLTPVGGDPIQVLTHRKPKAFVGSFLLWLFLLLLPLLFLLPWLVAWWRRWLAARGPVLLPEELAPPAPPAVPDPLPPLDLDKLVRPTSPTLVIGLGGTGRWTLTYLKKAVLETNYGRLPATVRFLLIDTRAAELETGTEEVRVGGVELGAEEILLLHEDPAHPAEVSQRTRRMHEEGAGEPHLRDWWPAAMLNQLPPEQLQISRGTNQRRPLGRMALFLDLENGVESSRFWSAVADALLGVTSADDSEDPTVFIAASAVGGTGSALSVDVAYLTRKIGHREGHGGIRVNLLLALQNSFAALSDQLGLTGSNAFATLRELDRFLACRDRRFAMAYSGDAENPANGRLDFPLLDNCFVFDAEREVRPLTGEHPRRGIFPAMADTIHTFLYTTPGSAFDHEIKQKKAVAELAREASSGHGVVSSLGTFIFRLPMYEFLQTFKVRFARELLVEAVGARFDEVEGWRIPAPDPDEQALLDHRLEDFLRRDGAERTPADVLQAVAESDPEMLAVVLQADRAHKGGDEYVRLHLVNARRYLAAFWIRLLNGLDDDGEPPTEVPAGLFPAALYLSEQLQRQLGLFREQARHHRAPETALIERLVDGYQKMVADVLGRLAAHRDGFADPRSVFAALDAEERRQREARQLDSDVLVREYFYDQALEERLYRDHLGDETRRRCRARLVWQCRESGESLAAELEVMTTAARPLPPHDKTSKAPAVPLVELAELVAQPMWDQEVTPYVEQSHPSAKDLADKVYERAAPLVGFESAKAVHHTSKLFSTLGEGEYADEVLHHLYPHFARQQHVQRSTLRDPHCLSHVRVFHSLPLVALRPWEQSSRSYHAHPERARKALHVFAAEQRAVDGERRLPAVREPSRAFHPRFVSYLDELDRARLYADCVLFGLIPEALSRGASRLHLATAEGGASRPLVPEQADVPALVAALSSFVDGRSATGERLDFDEIGDAVARKRSSVDERAVLEERLAALDELRSRPEGPPEYQDVLSYLAIVCHGELERLRTVKVEA